MLVVTPGAYQSTYGGAGDAFVSVLDPTGFFNLYTTYLGGSGLELAEGVAVDGAENAYVTGTTQSDDFPVTPGVFEGEHPDNGNGLAFVARIVPVLQSPTATMTASATPVTTPVSTFMNPPTPTTARTPLPTHSTNATPIPTMTIPTPVQTAQGGGTPTLTVTRTATATPTATRTGSPTASPTPGSIGTLRIAPLTITFPKIKVGKESGFKAVGLANPGANKGAAMLTRIVLQSQLNAIPTGFEIDARSTCRVGTPIPLGRACKIYLRFAPLAVGSVADVLVISGNFTSNAVGPVGLVGTGK